MIKQKVNILIVDDTPQNLVALNAILSDLGQNLHFADSAKVALRKVLEEDFAVILLDVHMPDIDGFETARLIRSREKSSYVPIIFMSALNKDEIDINQGYAMGAVDYIFKPINPVILRSKIQVFVDLFTKSTLAINLQNELEKRQRVEQRARKQQHQLALAELERLSSMEEMTSALAHELNQPLTTIANYVKGCMHLINSGNFKHEQVTSALEHAAQQAERAGAILHRIKNFVRKNELYLEPVCGNELINNVILLIQDTANEAGIKLSTHLSEENIPKILLDKIQMEQVILNILRNGMEALQSSKQSTPQLMIQTKVHPNKTFSISVQDNGPGIKSEHLKKLFDLYFTTKKHGMGVGLAICRTVVEAHGGNILAKNIPTGGACFEINLPIMEHNEKT